MLNLTLGSRLSPHSYYKSTLWLGCCEAVELNMPASAHFLFPSVQKKNRAEGAVNWKREGRPDNRPNKPLHTCYEVVALSNSRRGIYSVPVVCVCVSALFWCWQIIPWAWGLIRRWLIARWFSLSLSSSYIFTMLKSDLQFHLKANAEM